MKKLLLLLVLVLTAYSSKERYEQDECGLHANACPPKPRGDSNWAELLERRRLELPLIRPEIVVPKRQTPTQKSPAPHQPPTIGMLQVAGGWEQTILSPHLTVGAGTTIEERSRHGTLMNSGGISSGVISKVDDILDSGPPCRGDSIGSAGNQARKETKCQVYVR